MHATMGGMIPTEVRGDETLTRTEALEIRGYPPDIINGTNGNGHAEKPPENSSGGPSCSQCSKPAVPGRPTCGERQCIDKHRRARKRASYAAAAPKANGKIRPAPAVASLEDLQSPADPIFNALMLAGAELVRLEVVVAGECWTVTRSVNGGTT